MAHSHDMPATTRRATSPSAASMVEANRDKVVPPNWTWLWMAARYGKPSQNERSVLVGHPRKAWSGMTYPRRLASSRRGDGMEKRLPPARRLHLQRAGGGASTMRTDHPSMRGACRE
jgi:hypothetical protein